MACKASRQEASRREASNVVDLTSDHESADSFAGNSQDSASSVQSRKRFSSFVHDLTDDTPSKKGKQEVVDLTAENGPHAANPPRVESQFLTPKVEGVSSLFPVSSLEEADNLQRAMALSLAGSVISGCNNILWSTITAFPLPRCLILPDPVLPGISRM